MATPLQATTLDFDAAKLISIYGEIERRKSAESDLRPRLNAVLQTTLDVGEILKLFFEQIQVAVNVGGMTYTQNAYTVNVEIGETHPHSCSYRLQTKEDYLGELIFYRNRGFNQRDTRMLELLISTLVYPLRNALRYQEAVRSALTDPLTGAGNRIALENVIGREIELAIRSNKAFSILLIDVDRFKSINDNYGHSAGDLVLKSVVKAIKATSRLTDMAFRYGGEEFVVVMNHTDAKGAQIIAERLRAAIAGLSCIYDNSEIPVTVSIGTATWTLNESREHLFNRADIALYTAKHNGRNLVCVSETLQQMDVVAS